MSNWEVGLEVIVTPPGKEARVTGLDSAIGFIERKADEFVKHYREEDVELDRQVLTNGGPGVYLWGYRNSGTDIAPLDSREGLEWAQSLLRAFKRRNTWYLLAYQGEEFTYEMVSQRSAEREVEALMEAWRE